MAYKPRKTSQNSEHILAARKILSTLPPDESGSEDCSDDTNFHPLSDSGDDDPDLMANGHGDHAAGNAPNR